MKKIAISIVILFCFSCKKHDKKSVIEINCISKLFNDSLLVSRMDDSIISIKNIRSNKRDSFISKTSNCLQPILDTNNNLYTLITDELFQCFNIKRKKTNWHFKSSEQINNFKLFENNLILNIRNYGLIVLDSKTGKSKFELKNSHSSECHSMLVNDFFVENDYLYVTDFKCSNLICFDLKSGKEVWNYKSKINGATQLLIVKDYVFCGITGDPLKKEGLIVLLDKFSGKLKFEQQEQFDLITKPIIFKNKIIYYSYNSKINEFNFENFKAKTLIELNNSGGICDGQFYLLENNIYFTDCNFEINKFDLNHNKLYKLGTASKSLTTIYKIDNKIEFVY